MGGIRPRRRSPSEKKKRARTFRVRAGRVAQLQVWTTASAAAAAPRPDPRSMTADHTATAETPTPAASLAVLRGIATRRARSAGLGVADAEDVAQAVTEAVHRANPDDPVAYVHGAARRAVAHHRRREHARGRAMLRHAAEPVSRSTTCPLDALLNREDAVSTLAALDALTLWNPAANGVVVEVSGPPAPNAAEHLVLMFVRILRHLNLDERQRRRRAAALRESVARLRGRAHRRRAETPTRGKPVPDGPLWRLARGLAFVGWVAPGYDAGAAFELVRQVDRELEDAGAASEAAGEPPSGPSSDTADGRTPAGKGRLP